MRSGGRGAACGGGTPLWGRARRGASRVRPATTEQEEADEQKRRVSGQEVRCEQPRAN